ncbi:MAG: hypothetical protein AAB486_01740 [Patescibacteria group bacterium]
MVTKAGSQTYSGWWTGNMASELYDVASLLRYFKGAFSEADFNDNVCSLLRTNPAEAEEMLAQLDEGGISVFLHNFAPNELAGESWDKVRLIRTFEWINRFRGDLWVLVAEILDVARLINATAEDLQAAGQLCRRFFC